MHHMKGILVAALVVLTGCDGNQFDGTYHDIRKTNPRTTLLIHGDKAERQHRRYLNEKEFVMLTSRSFTAEQKADKIILTRNDGKTYVYRRAADEKGLECISESCTQFLSDMTKAFVRMQQH